MALPNETNPSPPSIHLSSLSDLTREQAEARLIALRDRRHAAVQRYQDAQRAAQALADEKERAKASRALAKINVLLIQQEVLLDKTEERLREFDLGNYTMRKRK